eukprot:TRINITY_DN11272_c0_g1_i1.p1 TRINITY_DN11272_c0_g1~~TRINITY_DN11272_c0_g1_i1.p1  ORF type:complete len:2747 (-),score=476.15 TRINITY_DN11272_c0_g1_i1:166-8406(-)
MQMFKSRPAALFLVVAGFGVVKTEHCGNSSNILKNLKAVKYAPHMAGATFNDKYDRFQASLYLRDLSLISTQLGANAVRLVSPGFFLPEAGTWKPFLDACSDRNLSVIPTFSIHEYLSQGIAASEMEALIQEKFGPYMRYFLEDVGALPFGAHPCMPTGGTLHKAVKFWSVNGLPTLETLVGSSRLIAGGYSAADDLSLATRRLTKIALRAVRSCVKQMLGGAHTQGQLALSVDLSFPSATVGTSGFVSSLEAMMQSFEQPDFEGNLFDLWILEAKLPPLQSAVQAVVQSLEDINKTHTVLKPILPQIGVAAAIRKDRKPNLVPHFQQEMLLYTWERTRTIACGSLIVDEFSDDWSRSASKECKAQGDSDLIQSFCGEPSGLLQETDVVPEEFLGLVSHTNWFLHSCVRPRWDKLEAVGNLEESFCLLESARDLERGFHFYAPGLPNNDLPPCYCVLPSSLHVYVVGGPVDSLAVYLVGLALLVLLFGALRVRRQTKAFGLSAGRLTLLKAIAYFDNQLGMGRSAALRRSRPKPKKGVSVISAHGESSEILMILDLSAFVNDPRRMLQETVSLSVKCRSLHADIIRELVKNAWLVQQRVLEHHVLAEERCLALRWNQWKEDTFKIAVTNVWRRALESYHLWVGQSRDTVKDINLMFQETLMFYTLQALAEQVLHCPEVMNTLFHLLLGDDEPGSGILRYDLMCKLLDDYIHNSDPFFLRGLTLDDLNDAVPRQLRNCSMIQLERLLKGSTYKGAVKSKFYPARGMLAALKLALDFRPAFEMKTLVGILAYSVFTEDIVTRPGWFLGRWARYHAIGLGMVELMTLWNLGYVHASWARASQMLRRISGGIASLAMVAVFYMLPDNQYVQHFLPPAFLGFRAVYLLLMRNNLPLPFLRPHQSFPQGPKDPKPKFDSEGATAAFWKRLVYWLLVLLFCFLGEVYMVFPVLEGLSFEALCSSRCQPLLWQSECIACYGSMTTLYLMIASMLVIDVFMGHVLFTSVVGIVLGTRRGLNGMRKAPDSAVFLSDSELGVGENNPRAGKLMQRVFGNGWRHTWNLMCYRLWKEDLLSSSEADELMQMASKKRSDANPDAPVYLHTLHPVVRERFTFFFASLRTICEDRLRMEENPPISHHGIFRTHDIMPLSQVLPAVNEEVILQDAFLQAQDGANLRWIIMKYPKEWERLTARLAESNLLNRYVGKAQPNVSDKTRIEVRLWASMRSQTVMRTVQGAVNYHIALEANPTIVSPHSTIRKRDQLAKYVELVWSHQTHGEDNKKDCDVRRLLSLYEDYPIYLVFDLDMVHLTTLDRKIMGQMVRRRLREDMEVSDEYLDDSHFFDHFPFVSCKAMYNKRPLLHERRELIQELGLGSLDSKFISSQVDCFDPTSVLNLEIVEAMPRRLALMIGKNKANLTQGKAGNQLMALRFCRGFALQAMDANMGSFIGEAFKVPMVLKRFQPRGSSRDRVTARLIGFREHIFTVAHGVCGDINAVAEWCFGTSIQRVQTWLGVRMHYGHPDFVDLYWARNRGSMSKATPHINLSEDIYLGFNVKNRGEKSDHFDFLEWEKGREVSFNAASTFLYKISGGNIGVWRSKDLTESAMTLPTVDQFSFYFATVGYFASLTIIDMTMYFYIAFHLLLTFAGISLHELGNLGTTMSVEWILGPGFFMYLPPLFEGLLEYGGLSEGLRRIVVGFDSTASVLPGGLLYWAMTLMFFTFQNKTKSSAVRQALKTGTATYRATGRPNANTRLTLIDTFLQYRAMHYQDACIFLFYYILYRSANMGLAGALPMGTIMFACVCWLIVPTLFAPYPSWENLCEDVETFYHFMMRCPADRSRAELYSNRTWLNLSASGNKPAQDVPKKGAKGQPGNLFEVLLADAAEKDTRFNYRFSDDCLSLLWSGITTVVMFAIFPSATIEAMEFGLLLWVVHVFLVLSFGIFLDLLWVVICIGVFLLAAARATSFNTTLLAGMLFLQCLDFVAKLLLFVTRRWRKLPGRGRTVTAKNARVGMKVLPGKDWMYDMKKDDVKQNAAPGCSMVGTITNCDDCQELGYCEVLWVNGCEGRYRVATSWQTASDLRRHPDFYAVCVEATVLLFGTYHINLLCGFVALIAHALTSIVLIAADSNWFGNWHARMLRMPTKQELDSAGVIEGASKHGSVGAPPIAMTELQDEIVLEDLKREPWSKSELKPGAEPLPPAAIVDDPAYTGAEWKAVCRVKLTKASVRMSVENLRKEFGLVAVAVESCDGLACGLDVPLQVGGSLLFGFENGIENWETVRGFLGLQEEDEDPRDIIERVWLPVYKFKVPKILTGSWRRCSSRRLATSLQLSPDVSDRSDLSLSFAEEGRVEHAPQVQASLRPRLHVDDEMHTVQSMSSATASEGSSARCPVAWRTLRGRRRTTHLPAQELRAPEMCGVVRGIDGSTQWFPALDVVLTEGDEMMLPQGSVRNFAMLRAKALFGQHCIGAGFKMVYSIDLPKHTKHAGRRHGSNSRCVTPTSRCTTRATTLAPSECESTLDCKELFPEQNFSAFEFVKLFAFEFLPKESSSCLACASKASYRAAHMPHLRPHAAAFGIVTMGVEQDTTNRAQLMFGFADDVPHERGLSLFCGFEQKEDLDRHIGSRWLPVFNFHVPEAWAEKSVEQVLQDEDFCICGICRRDADSSRELWFPGLEEKFEYNDELVLTLASAESFFKKYIGTGLELPKCTSTETSDARKLQQHHLSFLWHWRQKRNDDQLDHDDDLELYTRVNRRATVQV